MASNRRSDGTFKKGTHWREPQPHWNKDWLFAEYVTKHRSAKEIAEQVGCKENNIVYWLAKHGIPRRTMTEVRKVKHWGADGAANPMFGKCDEANPNWKGGVSPERQKQYARAMWKAIKQAVFTRDGHACQRCGESPTGHKALHTHHKKPWKRNPYLRFDTNNITTLCRACHEWVHSLENTSHEFLG